MKMCNICAVTGVLVFTFLAAGAGLSQPPGASDARAKAVFQEIRAAADSNKDGKLAVGECRAIYKDKQLGEKNCAFWDVNKDGVITEAEYVAQAKKLGGK